MKKITKIAGILLALVLIALTGAIIVFRNEIRTLASTGMSGCNQFYRISRLEYRRGVF